MKPSSDPLAALRDIHLPAEPSWWPPAPGWWLLAALTVVTVAWLGRMLWHRYDRARRRRRVLARLERLLRDYDAQHACRFVAGVAELLRRVALSHYPREQVAPLAGDAWLRFLDEHGGQGQFSDGPGRVLADGLYRSRCEVDPQALARLARAWVQAQAGGGA